MIRELEAEFKARMHRTLYFDGVDDYVRVENVEVKPSITVIAWAKSATPVFNTWGWFVSSRVANGFVLHPSKDSRSFDVVIYNSEGKYYHCGEYTLENIRIWHQYGFSYDADAKKVYIIVDGEFVREVENNIDRSTGIISVRIGKDYGFPKRYGHGFISEVLIYNRVLSESEVRYLYNNPFSPILDELVLWLAPASIDIANGKWWDLSGKNHHGVIYGCTEVKLTEEEVIVL